MSLWCVFAIQVEKACPQNEKLSFCQLTYWILHRFACRRRRRRQQQQQVNILHSLLDSITSTKVYSHRLCLFFLFLLKGRSNHLETYLLNTKDPSEESLFCLKMHLEWFLQKSKLKKGAIFLLAKGHAKDNLVNNFLKKIMGQPRPLFCLFSVFSNKHHYNFYNKYIWKKCPSSIRCRDSNPQPSYCESLPITTRPGLLTYFLGCWWLGHWKMSFYHYPSSHD